MTSTICRCFQEIRPLPLLPRTRACSQTKMEAYPPHSRLVWDCTPNLEKASCEVKWLPQIGPCERRQSGGSGLARSLSLQRPSFSLDWICCGECTFAMFLLQWPGKPVKNHLLSLLFSRFKAQFAARFGKAIVPFQGPVEGALIAAPSENQIYF